MWQQLHRIVKYIKKIMYVPQFFWFLHSFKEDNKHVSSFEKKTVTLVFFSDTIKSKSCKLCTY